MDLERMGERSSSPRSLSVSSTCTVSRNRRWSPHRDGAAPEEIAWGVHLAISERIAALAERSGWLPAVLTGGVAKNRGAQGARGPVPDPLPRAR